MQPYKRYLCDTVESSGTVDFDVFPYINRRVDIYMKSHCPSISVWCLLLNWTTLSWVWSLVLLTLWVFSPQQLDDAGWWFWFGQTWAVNNVHKPGGSRKKNIYSFSCSVSVLSSSFLWSTQRETIMLDDFSTPPSEPEFTQEMSQPCWHMVLGGFNPDYILYDSRLTPSSWPMALVRSDPGDQWFWLIPVDVRLWCTWEHCNKSVYLCCMNPKYYK